jgi:hypothetical protein
MAAIPVIDNQKKNATHGFKLARSEIASLVARTGATVRYS